MKIIPGDLSAFSTRARFVGWSIKKPLFKFYLPCRNEKEYEYLVLTRDLLFSESKPQKPIKKTTLKNRIVPAANINPVNQIEAALYNLSVSDSWECFHQRLFEYTQFLEVRDCQKLLANVRCRLDRLLDGAGVCVGQDTTLSVDGMKTDMGNQICIDVKEENVPNHDDAQVEPTPRRSRRKSGETVSPNQNHITQYFKDSRNSPKVPPSLDFPH